MADDEHNSAHDNGSSADSGHTPDAGHGHGHAHGHAHNHDHDHANCDHDHAPVGEDRPDMSSWLANTQKLSCPACGASGALTLGGGIFCPTCGEVSTNAGFQAPTPPSDPQPES